MTDQHDLDRALRALASETDADAGPAVEQRLRAAFRALPPEAAPAQAPPALWIALPSFAAAAGIVWLAFAGRGPVAAPAVPVAPPVARAEPAPLASASPAPSVPVVEAVRRARVRRPARRAEPAPFEALYPGDPLADLDAVHVVRVSVPRSSLFALGLAQRPGAQDDAVEMDAMVGPDGVARAVRFVTAR
ncbi:MAG: hypothetical protein ABW221_23815 [Vicinamibacteria bacterium]